MTTRGIRGAITIESDTEDFVLEGARALMDAILASNLDLRSEDVASILFTVTEDIVSAYPARAVRQMGWEQVPLMCAREIPVAESLPLCIRLLIHWNTEKPQHQIKHVYLRDAVQLRPDLIDHKKEAAK
jgi:chorismate mutase